MNWDHQLSSILSEADGSVAKMRERLTTHARSPRGTNDLYPVRESDLKRSSSLSPHVHWSDLTAIQTQLQQQNQAIETLTHSVRLLERERNAQQRLIQTLQEEKRKLQIRLEERETDRRPLSPGSDRRLEQWKRDMDGDLSSLRDHINRTISLGTHEESFSSKRHREELEQLRREIDVLKNKLMRQEEDVYQIQTEARETRRQNEHNSKALERLTESHRTQSFEVTRMVSQYKDVCELRVTVSELKDEVRGLILRDIQSKPVQLPTKPVTIESNLSRRLSSGSEDEFSLTPSLGEISSDEPDASWLGEPEIHTKSGRRRAHLNSGLSGSDLSGAGSGLDSDLENEAGGVDRVSNSPPDLSLSDL
ncbi:uncharacterized protein [Paramisgurnus dabryanus]|uniref:uncharacterized protein isoform X2 n=1 Tax=Paramisgurnus dabryanus TaxID=90735 RepID=UPI0031F39045